MYGIKIEVTDNIVRVIERPARITAGTVGLPVEFSFGNQWEGLSKAAVFRAGCVEMFVENIETQAAIPWEVLEKPDVWLSVGVYGVNADGSVAIPTIWANVGVIRDSADLGVSPAPTPPVWQRIWNAIGNLTGLTTNAKGNLVEAINEVNNIAIAGGIESDPTLSQSGKAADAKATGDALAQKAPAGYGLGNIAYNLTEIVDANSATMNGWYLLGKDAANGFGYKGVMRVDAYSSYQLMQTLYTQGYSSKIPIVVQRMCVEGNWSEWAFLNPVVGDGGEYRTTELHEGKPVYTQLFNLGAVTASGEVTVSIPGLSYGIRYAGRIGSAPLPILSTTALYADTYSDGATIGWVCGHSNWIGRIVYCQLWYVKD